MSSSPYYFLNSDLADSTPQTPPHDFVHDDVTVASSDVDGNRSAELDRFDLPESGFTETLSFGTHDKKLGKESKINEVFDPLLLAAIAAASGPHTTRHHYHHHYSCLKHSHEVETKGPAWDISANNSDDEDDTRSSGRQSPQSAYNRTSHAKEILTELKSNENIERTHFLPLTVPSSGAVTPELVHSQLLLDSGYLSDLETSNLTPDRGDVLLQPPQKAKVDETFDINGATSDNVNVEPVEVNCMVRARIPTPYGEAFLHLYHNSRDAKEHLAIVVDPAQLDFDNTFEVPSIRSKSLDTIWPGETEADRITRGAYVGRLSAQTCFASVPISKFERPASPLNDQGSYVVPPPIVRIHSECFTGETIGSLRCDCGEQLDEALRLIFQPQSSVPINHSSADDKTPSNAQTVPGRGAVIYMRQEGRGIGLLEKLRAYNLQDLGHDTVAANLLLGRGADERKYDVAGAILKDLGLAGTEGEGIKLLTNNPDKVAALESEGVHVVERVPMVPRSWQSESHTPISFAHSGDLISGLSTSSTIAGGATQIGAVTVGATVVRGKDLDKYLRTKVLKMGHMLSLPQSSGSTISAA